MYNRVKDSWGSSPLQFLLISFLITSSTLSQNFHMLCGLMSNAIASACLHWVCSSQQRKGLRMLAQKAALPPLPINWGQTGEGISGARGKADSCLQTPTSQEQRRARGWQRDWRAESTSGQGYPTLPLNWSCIVMALGLKSLKISHYATAST